jgi:hypothetical protein
VRERLRPRTSRTARWSNTVSRLSACNFQSTGPRLSTRRFRRAQ